MDPQKLSILIDKMIQPGSTVLSLTMCAEKLGRSSQEDLAAFMSALCRQNVYKAATVAQRLRQDIRNAAAEPIYEALAEHCQPGVFSHWDLLAITAFEDAPLLAKASPLLAGKHIHRAFSSADEVTACKLLRMGLTHLSGTPCSTIQDAFSAFLEAHNNTSMDKAFPELLPVLLAHNANDLVAAWIRLLGAEKADSLYGRPLAQDIRPLLLSGNGSLPMWEIFLSDYFSNPHTEKEIREECLTTILTHAGRNIINEVGAWFYLYIAAQYGADHPVFDAIFAFSTPQTYSSKYRLRYAETFRGLWQMPAALALFLEKTAIFNPYLTRSVQGRNYTLASNRQDLPNYDRLVHLFETQTPIRSILTLFFHTDLRRKLPLEDLFSLARDYGVLAELLELLKDVPFSAVVTKHRPHLLVLSPFSYFVTELHTIPMSYRIVSHIGSPDLTAKTLSYHIVDFLDDTIVVAFCPSSDATVSSAPLSWADALAEFREALCQPEISDSQLQQLSVANFSADPLENDIDFDLLTQLLLDDPTGLPVFLRALKYCKWNALFVKNDLQLPGQIYARFRPYCQKADRLFRHLFASGQDPDTILTLYLSSIYKAILPLNQLLLMADRELLLTLLPGHTLYCRIREGYEDLCRFMNINCSPICAIPGKNHIPPNRPFAAHISGFTVQENYVYRIVLQPVENDPSLEDLTASLFKYIASNKRISRPKVSQFALLPPTTAWHPESLIHTLHLMEKAIMLRKSDGAALMDLLQFTEKVNPFAFQSDPKVDLLYLCSRLPRSAPDATDTGLIIINARDIGQICHIYLNTHIKFHLTIHQLITLIQQRRPDLCGQIPAMFEDTVFHALAEGNGLLWLPWVKQGSLRVSAQYAGQFLRCRLSCSPDGSISVSVIDVFAPDFSGELMDICLEAGYLLTPYMRKLSQQFAGEDKSSTQQKIDYTAVFPYIVNQFKHNLRSKFFRHTVFAEELDALIRKHHNTVPAREMISAITELVVLWAQLYPNEPLFQNYLFSRHIVFCRYYQSVGLGLAFCQLADKLLPEKPAVAFKRGVAKSIKELTGRTMELNMDPSIPPIPEDRTSDSYKEHLAICAESLNDATLTFQPYCKRICDLIRNHHKTVSAQSMCADITGLMSQWLSVRGSDPQLSQLLHGVHTAFIRRYRSDILDKELCRLYAQHTDEAAANRFEQQLKNSFCRLTGQPVPERTAPPPVAAVSYEAYLTQCRELLNHPLTEPKKYCKQLCKMVRVYCTSVPAEQMEADIVGLMEVWLPAYYDTADVPTLLYGIHDSFLRKYASESMGQALLRLYSRYANEAAAQRFAKRLQKALQNLNQQE